MKVLFVTEIYHSCKNGTSVSAQRYAYMLRKFGHEVRVLAVRSDNPNIQVDYPLDEVQVYGFRDIIHVNGFAYAKPDPIVIQEAVQWAEIVHFYMPLTLTWKTIPIVEAMGKPATAAFHIQPENITSQFGLGKCRWLNRLIYTLFRKKVYDHFRRIHTPSVFMANQLKEQGYKAQLYPISNGICSACHYMKEPKPEAWRERFVITMVGRLSNEKRQDVLIRAVRHSRYSDRIQLVLAGQGPKQAAYERLGHALPNQPIFCYHSKTELIHLMAQTDLYVHTSDMESEAIACIEAIACGLVPVIAKSPQSAAWQFALDERSLFEPGNAHDLAQKIDYWIEHTDERQRMEKKYADSAKQYRLEDCVRQFENMLLEEIAETNRCNERH